MLVKFIIKCWKKFVFLNNNRKIRGNMLCYKQPYQLFSFILFRFCNFLARKLIRKNSSLNFIIVELWKISVVLLSHLLDNFAMSEDAICVLMICATNY